MKNLWVRYKEKVFSIIASVSILVILLTGCTEEKNYSLKYDEQNLITEYAGREGSYDKYLIQYEAEQLANEDISIDIFSYTDAKGASRVNDLADETSALMTEEDGFIEYLVPVNQAGLYSMYIEYLPLESRGVDIERMLTINGEIPFLGAESIVFNRIWGDSESGIKIDNQGNEIRPAQVEKPRWERTYLKDRMGYFTEPYQFYLEKGNNTIRLTGINEPMAIRKIVLTAMEDAATYDSYIKQFDLSQYENQELTYLEKIQGEVAPYRSSPSLYQISDRSSGITEPESIAQVKFNMIGGQSWRVPGQWIEWEVEVPENGMYSISINARQNYNRGMVSNRSVLIDGEIPCEEAAVVPFKYNNKWSLTTIQDNTGENLYFPLTKGTHSIRLEVTLGELGEMLNTMEGSVYRLNAMYRKILVLTGAEPDQYRDYRIEVIYPEVIEDMARESQILYKLVDDLTSYSGERGSQTAAILTLASQLELFTNSPDKIPISLVNFKQNISALGDGLLALSQSQLDVDYLIVSAKDAELPVVKESLLTSAWHESHSFLASFFVNYNNLGDIYSGGNVVEVWMLSGRDQSNILKSMIDDTFTSETGIGVNVKLVSYDAVMPAVVAGTGPDIVLSIGQGEPINYAVRNAAQDLSDMPGFDEITKQFAESAITPFRYNDGVYALPETQNFQVMFYRTDILEELGVSPPQTWEELINIIPVIQKSNMNVGVPSVANVSAAGTAAPDLSGFYAQLYQRGGALYNEQGSRTLLDGETAVKAFDAYTKFFMQYKTPTIFDFTNRFRTGEIPIGFADYTVFNTLEVFAPEIRGLWEFAPMPGVMQENGEINRSVSSGSSACMMFDNTDDKDISWKFMQWWVSEDTQLRFGREMESIMGSAARYPTANIGAFQRLSWSTEEMSTLNEQRKWAIGTPEVPGGYYASRHIINAVRKVLNDKTDSRETLLDYTQTINDELLKKRKEFGLE